MGRPKGTKKNKVFSCKICKKIFKRKDTLDLHLKRHEGDKHKVHSCCLCDYKGLRNIDLIYHIANNHLDKIINCSVKKNRKTIKLIQDFKKLPSEHLVGTPMVPTQNAYILEMLVNSM